MKQKKSILLIALALVMFCTFMLPKPVQASATANGTCGKNVTWTFEDGVLTISGSGAMDDYSRYVYLPWVHVQDQIHTVVIEEGVTSIGMYAFYNHNLSDITIPDSVEIIGDGAFDNCSGLAEVTIGSGVARIGEWAFRECGDLQTVNISDSVTDIGPYAFYGCENLKSIIIPDSVETIGALAFQNCTGLEEVVLGKGVENIGFSAFSNCKKLKDIVIPDGVTVIQEGVFYNCENLTTVTFPAGISEIRYYAFNSCNNLWHLLYTGTEEQWKSISIESDNDALKNVTLHYNAVGDEIVELNKHTCTEDIFYECHICGEFLTNPVVGGEHVWGEATCTTPETCEKCGETTGTALGHDWSEVTCIEPKTCKICGETTGTALGHDWSEATCIEPKTCKICGETTGTALGHDWSEATCIEPKTCKICGETTGTALGHDWSEATCIEPKTCKTCGETSGNVLEHEWSEWYLVQKANCIEDGKQQRDCLNCDHFEEKKVPATGHTYIDGKCDCGVEDPEEIKPTIKFEDVEANAYYATPVQWAVENGITNGYGSATTFCPDITCTRGQVVTFLWRTKGCPEPTSTVNPFTDIKESDYYYKAVLWAVENGITSGYGSSTIFNPDGACTRGQVATFLWRAEGQPSMSDAENPFTDVAAGEYYYDAVLWAVANGVTNGYGGSTTFAPDVICNRGQIVTFLYRAEQQ